MTVSLGASGKNVLRHVYAARGACLDLFGERVDEVLLSGPAGTGKSRACLEKVNRCALKYPGIRALLVRKTHQSLTQSAMVTWQEHVVGLLMEHGIVTYYGGSSREAAGFKYSNGSVVNIGGMDNPTKIMSTEYDLIYVQEAVELTENDWESAVSRLRNGKMPYQQIIADTNPSAAHHWLKQRTERGQTLMLHSRHTDNPRYWDGENWTSEGEAYVIGKLNKLTGVRKSRLADGLWVSAEGLVYENFDPAIHFVDRFNVPQDWARYWSVDFGFVHPFVCQFWAEDPDGKLYLYREIYMSHKLVEQHAADILDIVAPVNTTTGQRDWIEPKPQAIVCDHDAEGRATLEKHLGLGTQAAEKKVLAGIDAVASRFESKRLFLMRDSVHRRDATLQDLNKPTSTGEEILTYVWDTGNGKSAKEQPIKLDDDGMDTMRYIVAYKDLKKRSGTRGWV